MKKICGAVIAVLIALSAAGVASATSQAARKTGLDCQTCHAGFPRLNQFGEEYMRAGYRVPGEEIKEEIDRIFLERVSDYFGVRLNVDAVSWAEGTPDDSVAFGNDKWSQFFIMGPIADRFSFFTEIEITSSKTHHTWWKLGWHPSKAANLVIGNQSPIDHASFSNRLRILPAVKSATFGLKNSQGAGVSSVNASSARPGVQLHGDLGENFVYYTGISNGRGEDPDLINTWAGLRFYFPTSGTFAGSSVSATYYGGSDVDPATETIENDFNWIMPALNIRVSTFDMQAYARIITEDNAFFDPTPGVMDEDYTGWGFTAGWMLKDSRFQPAIQYDKIEASAISAEVETILGALSYFPRDNLRAAIYYETDQVGDADRAFINLRMMF